MTTGLWYQAALRHDGIDELVSLLREQFTAAVEAAGWPEGACLFCVTGEAGNETAPQLFFSPAAISAVPHLIAACGAEPSPPPDRARATLLVGKQTDWDLLPHVSH
jgi:hypothetical protein